MSASEFNGYQYRLKTTIEVCLNHINNNTFDEDDFKYCFSQFEGYMKTYTEYYEEHGKYPNSIIDERKMSKLYSYYNSIRII